MSVASEIQRLQNAKASIKSSIEAKGVTVPSETKLDGYSTLIDNIPSGGGGMTINGTLISREIQTGAISKGDFVKRGEYSTEDRVSSSAQMNFGTNPTITNESNLYDNNDNTYAEIKANVTSSLSVTADCKNRTNLNIPATALIKSVSASAKFRFASANGAVNTFVKVQSTGSFFAEGMNETQTTTVSTFTRDFTTLGETWDTNSYRLRFYCLQASSIVQIYYIKFDITYEYDGQIKKVSSDADTTIGIANENGSQGDTIQIYIPNVE